MGLLMLCIKMAEWERGRLIEKRLANAICDDICDKKSVRKCAFTSMMASIKLKTPFSIMNVMY